MDFNEINPDLCPETGGSAREPQSSDTGESENLMVQEQLENGWRKPVSQGGSGHRQGNQDKRLRRSISSSRKLISACHESSFRGRMG